MNYTGISLFSGGVDGLGIAFEVAGFNVTHYVEYEPFCAANLRRLHPSAVVIEDDIRNVTTLPTADVIFGGPPCQGFSVAGKRLGLSDDRYLWPEMFRLVRVVQPRVVLVENVRGAASGGFIDAVCSDLESEGYTCGTFLLPACLFGAPHERYRICIVAHTQRQRHTESCAITQPNSDLEWDLAASKQTRTTEPDENFPSRQVLDNSCQSGLAKWETQRAKLSPKHPTSQRASRGTGKRKQRRHESRLGRATDRRAHWLDGLEPARDFPGWPAGQGIYQHSYEPPRTVSKKKPYHKERIQAIGNAVVWQQFLPFAQAIYAWLATEEG